MEKGHGTTVNKFLDRLNFKQPFTFLDIGCGNGWVVRKISQLPNCRKAIGIDKSKTMIKKAREKKISENEFYFITDLESWKYTGKFDVVFSMESLYYSVPMEPALKKVYKLLKKEHKSKTSKIIKFDKDKKNLTKKKKKPKTLWVRKKKIN